MKTKKRLLAALLGLCAMAAGLFWTLFPVESAQADTAITLVEVNVEIPLVGAEDNHVVFSVPEDAGYTVAVNNGDGFDGLWKDGRGNPVDTFQIGLVYHEIFSVSAKDGFVLSPYAEVQVNGSDAGVLLVDDEGIPASKFEFSCEPVLLDIITEVELSGLPSAVPGEVAVEYRFTAPDGSYTVYHEWTCYHADSNGYVLMIEGVDRFAEGEFYHQLLFIELEDGYILDPDCVLTIDGEKQEFNNYLHGGYAEFYTSLAKEIYNVAIQPDALPEAVPGQPFGDKITVPLEQDGVAEAYGYWLCYNAETGIMETTGTFENGKAYEFRLTITPKPGYSLAEDFGVWYDNKWLQNKMQYSPAYAEYSLRTSFKKRISEVELLNLPEATVGTYLDTGVIPVAVPEGADYTASGLWHYFDKGWLPVDEADNSHLVQNGGLYQLLVDLFPAEGCEFDTDLLLEAYGTQHWPYAEPDHAGFKYNFNFREQIDSVEVTCLKELVIGQTPSVEGLQVGGEGYIVKLVEWYDIADFETPVTVFEKGHAYQAEIELVSKRGYEFSQDCTALLNGEDAEILNWLPEKIVLAKVVSFEEVVKEIRLDNVPKMTVGEQVSTNVTIPADANYTVQLFWAASDPSLGFGNFNGIFEAGKVYRLNIIVAPNEGYRFDPDETVFLINGLEPERGVVMGEYRASYVTLFSSEGNPGIDEIHMTIAPPVVGEMGSIAPATSVPAGAHYSIAESQWITGDVQHFSPFLGAFEPDGQYGVMFTIEAADGFIFTADMVLEVNGELLPLGEKVVGSHSLTFSYFFDDALIPPADIPSDQPEPHVIKLPLSNEHLSAELKDAEIKTVTDVEIRIRADLLSRGISVQNCKLYDIQLQRFENDKWVPADSRYFPLDEQGRPRLHVLMDLPEGTGAYTDFLVAHMFSTSDFGNTPGDIEYPDVKIVYVNGKPYLSFHVAGLSPVMVAWDVSVSNLPNDGMPDHNIPVPSDQLPQTGDNTPIALWLLLLTASAAMLVALRRKRA